jgi:hypothetical protein
MCHNSTHSAPHRPTGLELFHRLRQALPNAVFGPPASEEQIARVEAALGTPFPGWLHELYGCCNGVRTADGDHYLLVLETSDGSQLSLREWNKVIRELWDSMVSDWKAHEPDADWDALNVRHILLIGYIRGYEWAIDPKGDAHIISFSMHNPDYREIIAADLAVVCEKNEQHLAAIHDELFRGRQPRHREGNPAPPSCDVELIQDMLLALHGACVPSLQRPSIPGRRSAAPSLNQGISQRPGEDGMLFVFANPWVEIQVASRDGNLPYVLKAKVLAAPDLRLRCLVRDLPEAFLCMLSLITHLDAFRTREAGEFEARAKVVQKIWQGPFGVDDSELQHMADMLFARDDRRMQEENRLGA